MLVNGQGRTLYTFAPDAATRLTCVKSCAEIWPALKLAGSAPAQASGNVRRPLVGSDPDPEGGRVVTYAGWPLYTYAGDTVAGQDSGQGLDSSGGLWYAISPAGSIVNAHP